MRFLKKTIKILFFTLVVFTSALFIAIYILQQNISSNYKIKKGETFSIDSHILPVTAEYDGFKASGSVSKTVGETFQVDLKIFGVIPFSKVNVEVVDESYVAVLGNPFGMKIYTEGVLVIRAEDVVTAEGKINPADIAGIKTGDYILSANGEKITCNEDLSKIVQSCNGADINIELVRSGKHIKTTARPVCDKESGILRLGIWVRDSSAGIGTLTFYSPATGIICGLGHGICDSDTDSLLSIESGQMVSAQIISVNKGKTGSPGELKGKFTYENLADIEANLQNGIYGTLKADFTGLTLTEVALKQDICEGEAQILCTVDGESPRLYSCTVKHRMSVTGSSEHDLVITVTDPDLLAVTGGIVQGMSGSPILQNGKLIGAVTHVLVDDPTAGYGIYAENMLETAQGIVQQQLKEAS